MNLPPFHALRLTLYAPRSNAPDSPRSTLHARHPRERGMAVISVLALVAIVLIYMTANIRTLNALDGELKLLERQQTHRLKASSRTAKIVHVPNAAPETQPAHD